MIRIASCILLAVLAGCAREELSGPPTIRLARDACAECGMLINEDHAAAAVIIENAGRREYLLFDDIGCLLDTERSSDVAGRVRARFVHDHHRRAWIDADAPGVRFLKTDPGALPTPMGTGMAAFDSAEAAEAARQTLGGEVFDFAGLAAHRAAWIRERFGTPRQPPADGP